MGRRGSGMMRSSRIAVTSSDENATSALVSTADGFLTNLFKCLNLHKDCRGKRVMERSDPDHRDEASKWKSVGLKIFEINMMNMNRPLFDGARMQ